MLGQNTDNTSALNHVFLPREIQGVFFLAFCTPHLVSLEAEGGNRRSTKVGKMDRSEGKRNHDESGEFQHPRKGGRVLFLKVRGHIYLFPWKLQWNFTEYFALMMSEIGGNKSVLPFGCWWWTIYYDAFKDTAWCLYDSAILCDDIHFIVPYNTNEEIKNKTAECWEGLALFIAI